MTMLGGFEVEPIKAPSFNPDWTLDEVLTRLRHLNPKTLDAIEVLARDALNSELLKILETPRQRAQREVREKRNGG